MMDPERWEHGGAIEYPAIPSGSDDGCRSDRSVHPLGGPDSRTFGNARQALHALAIELRHRRDLKRIFFPEHYCYSVIETLALPLAKLGVELRLYSDRSLSDSTATTLRATDMVIVNQAFGFPKSCPAPVEESGAVKVLDLSHGPFKDSAPHLKSYDYVFASLRKLLPVPDGGLLVSVGGAQIPNEVASSTVHDDLAVELDEALCLKYMYLRGAPVAKDHFYPKHRDIERKMASSHAVSAMSCVGRRRLGFIDGEFLSRRTIDNSLAFGEQLIAKSKVGHCPRLIVLVGGTFIYVSVDPPEMKSALVEALISRNIWPATLWPISPNFKISGRTRCEVESSFVLNCDSRYGPGHMAELSDRFSAVASRLGIAISVQSIESRSMTA